MAKSRNTSELRPFNYSISCKRLSNAVIFIQEVQIPEMVIEPINVPTQDATTPFFLPGDGIRSGNILTLTVKHDEDMTAWFDFYDWMVAIRDQDNIEQHMLSENPNLFADLILTIRGNNQQRVSEFTFRHCWPTRLSSFAMKTTSETDEIITFSVDLQISSYIALKKNQIELMPKGEPQ